MQVYATPFLLAGTCCDKASSVCCIMRTIRIWTIAIAGIATTIARADTGWSWQNPLPTGSSLSAAALLDANTATVVGSGGAILRTTDAGATWSAQPSGTTAYLSAVCFTDIYTGTVVGSNGAILRTTDGGATWTSQWPKPYYTFTGVSFTDAYTGTAVGANLTFSPPELGQQFDVSSGRILRRFRY